MRILLTLLALSACTRPAAQADLVSDQTEIADMIYVCSTQGEEAVQFYDSHNAMIASRPTGRACDYQAWLADVERYGPLRTHRTSPDPYGDWRRAHGDTDA